MHQVEVANLLWLFCRQGRTGHSGCVPLKAGLKLHPVAGLPSALDRHGCEVIRTSATRARRIDVERATAADWLHAPAKARRVLATAATQWPAIKCSQPCVCCARAQ